MRIFLPLALTGLIAAPALAGCPAGSVPILSCSFESGAKWLESCQDGSLASYAFGKAGQAADLELTAPVAELSYTPWPGIGRSIWEEVSFENKGITYMLWTSFDKIMAIEDENGQRQGDPLSAGLSVLKGEEELARLVCDRGSIDTRIDELLAAKQALGLCWDAGARLWAACGG